MEGVGEDAELLRLLLAGGAYSGDGPRFNRCGTGVRGTAVLSGGEITSFGMQIRPWLGEAERYDGAV